MEDSVRLKVRERTQGIAQGRELGLELFGRKFSWVDRVNFRSHPAKLTLTLQKVNEALKIHG